MPSLIISASNSSAFKNAFDWKMPMGEKVKFYVDNLKIQRLSGFHYRSLNSYREELVSFSGEFSGALSGLSGNLKNLKSQINTGNIVNFVGNINEIMSKLDKYRGLGDGIKGVKERFLQVFKENASALKNAGITIDSEDRLLVDENGLKTAVDDGLGELKDIFDKSGGILDSTAQNIRFSVSSPLANLIHPGTDFRERDSNPLKRYLYQFGINSINSIVFSFNGSSVDNRV